MEQPETPDPGSDDILSVGEGRVPRWARLGAVLVVLLLGMAAYRVVSAPSNPAAPEPAAAAQVPGSTFVVGGGRSERGIDGTRRVPVLRLAGRLVAIRGPGVQQPERETSATALGYVGYGWLVKLTSTACKDKTDVHTSYGYGLASGRFIPWTSSHTTKDGPAWRSPDHLFVLRQDGKHLVVHRTATGDVVAEFRTRR
jgi:hypothetical protein